MSEVKNIKCFQTTDNQLFVSKEEAREHQAEIDIYNKLDKKKFYTELDHVQPHELINWIRANGSLVRDVLGKPKPTLP